MFGIVTKEDLLKNSRKAEKFRAGYLEDETEMQEKFCPIKGDNCSSDCVHFQKAVVIEKESYPIGIICTPIGCKLWKDYDKTLNF